MDFTFNSRRSVVHSKKGMAASTQPLASSVGIRILEKGGNAAMAAVGMAAAMGVLEPQMTGLGGDVFSLFYDAKTKQVYGINGSGHSPKAVSVDLLRKDGVQGSRIPGSSVHSITVPGAVAAWCDVVEKWGNGKLTLDEILEPAIDLAGDGTPVSAISSQMWVNGKQKLLNASPNAKELLNSQGDAPKEGEMFVNSNMAKTLRRIADAGRDGFYKGFTADAIIETLKAKGGVMTHEDLASHKSTFVKPISFSLDDEVRLHEIPPNGQGLVALIALGIIKQLNKQGIIDLKSLKHNSVEYLHLISECLKFAFKDGEEYITDYEKMDYDVNYFLSEAYLADRAKLFDPTKVNKDFDHGVLNPKYRSDTSFFTCTDSEGNACSFIASLYTGFGSGVIPKECGFALQNRGSNFNLTPGTRNCLAGGKRPYHTIIPAMLTNEMNNSLYATYGVMGGFMQPQGHLQVLLNLSLFGLNPQSALDAPRLCLNADPDGEDSGLGADSPVSTPETLVYLEEGISEDVVTSLSKMGHKVKSVRGVARGVFGRGQVIRASISNGRLVYSAGSDLRGDGCAIAQI